MAQKSRRLAATLLAVVALVYSSLASARINDLPTITVSLPSGGTVDIALDIFENPNKNAGNKSVLAVHGLAHTGATFAPLANELFKHTGNDKVRRVLAINFPGRNDSRVPSGGVRFGDLTIEDYTAVLLGVLHQLPPELKIETIIAHSLGALIVQLAQNSLIADGTSLQREFGVKNVYLLAPSLPGPVTWSLTESQVLVAIVQGITATDQTLGEYIRLISDVPEVQEFALNIWLTLFFTNRMGLSVWPTPEATAVTLKYLSNESRVVIRQLLGIDGTERPDVESGIFHERVQKCFRLISFSEDLTFPEEYENLTHYLIGKDAADELIFIEAPDAVHDMYIANPATVARALTSCN